MRRTPNALVQLNMSSFLTAFVGRCDILCHSAARDTLLLLVRVLVLISPLYLAPAPFGEQHDDVYVPWTPLATSEYLNLWPLSSMLLDRNLHIYFLKYVYYSFLYNICIVYKIFCVPLCLVHSRFLCVWPCVMKLSAWSGHRWLCSRDHPSSSSSSSSSMWPE